MAMTGPIIFEKITVKVEGKLSSGEPYVHEVTYLNPVDVVVVQQQKSREHGDKENSVHFSLSLKVPLVG